MEKNQVLSSFNNLKKNRSSKNLYFNRITKRKISSPNTINNHLFKNKISKFPIFKTNSLRPKKNKFKFNFESLFEKLDKEDIHPINSLRKKKRNSVVFANHQIKNKIEKDIYNSQIELNEINLPNNISLDKENKNKNIKIIKDNKTTLDKKKSKRPDIVTSSLYRNRNSQSRLMSDKNLKIYEGKRKIFKTKHLYDSLEDSEELSNLEEDNFYFSPESNFILILDFLVLLCSMICIIYIPVKISGYQYNCIIINAVDIFCFYFIDILFIIDLLIGLYRGYYNNEFKIVFNNKKILKRYISTYFIYDFISAMPVLSLFVHYYLYYCIKININNNIMHYLIVILCNFKLLKYIKIKDSNKFLDNINDIFSKNYYSEKFFNSIKIMFMYFSILHYLVCCQIFIGYNFHPSWLFLIQRNYHMNNYLSIYITSLYYLITTLTTVGYGDIVCISTPERIYKLIELSLGIILYSYIISKLGDMVKAESYSTMKYNNNLAILEDIRVTYPNMSFKLYHKILHHLQTNINQQRKSNINLLINSLPYILQHTLLFTIHKNYITHFNFFKKCYNSNFITYSLLHFIPISYKRQTLLIKEDQLIDNVIFINEGRLSLEIAIELENPTISIKKYLAKNYNPLTNKSIIDDKYENSFQGFDESNYQFLNVSNIFKNEHYGEVFIIYNKPSPLFLRVKSKMANLFLLNKKNVIHLSTNYTNIWNRLFRKSLKNMIALKKKTINLVKKYVITSDLIQASQTLIEAAKKEEKDKTEEKIEHISGNLKNFITKNMSNIKSKSRKKSISACTMIPVKNISELIEKKDTKEKDLIKKSKKGKKIEEKKKGIDDKAKNKNKANYNQKEEIKYEKFSTMNIEYTKEVVRKTTIKIKSCKTLDANKRSYKYYAMRRLDKIKLRKLEIKLKEETKLRKYYQKLYNELNSKNKNLCVQLLNKSISTNNLDDNENGTEQENTEIMNDIQLNKLLINNINVKKGVRGININSRSLSMEFKNKNTDNNNRKRSLGSVGSNKNVYVKSKSKKIKRTKSLFKGGKRNSNKDSSKNVKKKIIVRKRKTKENVINRNVYNIQNITNINNHILKKKKTFCVNKIKKRDINNILSSSNNSDNSQAMLCQLKSIENKDNDTDDSTKKKNEFNEIKFFGERNKTKD